MKWSDFDKATRRIEEKIFEEMHYLDCFGQEEENLNDHLGDYDINKYIEDYEEQQEEPSNEN